MIDVTSDSLMRQERRAEAQSLLQIAAQLAAGDGAVSGAPLNLKAFMEKALDAYDVARQGALLPAAAGRGRDGWRASGASTRRTPGPAAAPRQRAGERRHEPGARRGPGSPSNVATM